MKNSKIIFDEALSLEYPAGLIDTTGEEKIVTFLYRLGLPRIPADWQWTSVVKGKGEYVGSFSKRIAKWAYKMGKKLTPDQLGQVGSLVEQYCSKESAHFFDFTSRLEWKEGDFGDSGSCFWSDRVGARPAMEEAGCFAMRFYKDSACKEGIGRAWIFSASNYYVVFNAYGPHSTLNVTRLLSHYLNYGYRRISLSNNGDSGGLIYINNCAGYVVGPESRIRNTTQYDMKISRAKVICENCESYTEDWVSPVGVYCRDCFSEIFSKCPSCDEWVESSDFVEVYYNNLNEKVCSTCADERYEKCSSCKRLHFSDNIVRTISGNSDLCKYCSEGKNPTREEAKKKAGAAVVSGCPCPTCNPSPRELERLIRSREQEEERRRRARNLTIIDEIDPGGGRRIQIENVALRNFTVEYPIEHPGS